MWKLQSPLKKVTPSKSWGPVKPPFLKIWLEFQPSPPLSPIVERGGGAHYGLVKLEKQMNFQLMLYFFLGKYESQSFYWYFLRQQKDWIDLSFSNFDQKVRSINPSYGVSLFYD